MKTENIPNQFPHNYSVAIVATLSSAYRHGGTAVKEPLRCLFSALLPAPDTLEEVRLIIQYVLVMSHAQTLEAN
jgi:hypothetical protein